MLCIFQARSHFITQLFLSGKCYYIFLGEAVWLKHFHMGLSFIWLSPGNLYLSSHLNPHWTCTYNKVEASITGMKEERLLTQESWHILCVTGARAMKWKTENLVLVKFTFCLGETGQINQSIEHAMWKMSIHAKENNETGKGDIEMGKVITEQIHQEKSSV